MAIFQQNVESQSDVHYYSSTSTTNYDKCNYDFYAFNRGEGDDDDDDGTYDYAPAA